MELDGWTAQGVAELTVHRPNSTAPKTIYYGHDDTGGSYSKGSDGHVLQQQWVTLTASMWPAEPPTEAPGGGGGTTGATGNLLSGWRAGGEGGGIPSDRLPLLAAVFCGAALVVCIVFAVIIYRCCVMNRKDKPYCTRKVDAAPSALTAVSNNTITATPATISTNGHHHYYYHHQPHQHHYYQQQVLPPGVSGTPTAVYAVAPRKSTDMTTSWGYTNRLLTTDGITSGTWIQQADGSVVPVQCTQCPGLCPSPVPRSSSVPGSGIGASPVSNSGTKSNRQQRPVSQPITVVVTNGDDSYKKPPPMPEISEFSPPSIQYASSSILDEVGNREDSPGASSLKTRSLPAWVRTKPRPLSTEDDLNDLYAKVNFSKKRKNRMRNDEAAIIALSKSRSQFLHKDTDSLVDNEAVIVYDERTAL